MQKIFKFVGVGIAATIVDYLVYSLVVMVIFGGNTNFAGVGAVSSGIVATFTAFILHSKITWKNRNPGKYGIIKFFAWNALVVIAIRPVLTFIFGLIGGLYEFVFMIFDGIGIGFSYEFVESTGIYVLMTVVTMTLNFFFYDRVVFGKNKSEEKREKVDVERIRKARKEEKGQGISNEQRDKDRS